MNLLIFLFVFSASYCQFKLGIESIDPDFLNAYRGDRVGLVTNQTGVDQLGNRTVDILIKAGISVVKLFAPEHGIDGAVTGGDTVQDGYDKKTGISVISLYAHGSGKKVNEALLRDIDTIMFDLQDCGMRHYTYISTLLMVMHAAARDHKKLVVFDRPNPLGGIMEGPLVESACHSFISIAAIPLRHGLTIGELAHYFNKYECPQKVRLQVVPLSGYQRNNYPFSGILAPLSPNLQSLLACQGYSFLGLLGEISPFEVGINTAHAFRYCGLPLSHGVQKELWKTLQKKLFAYGIESYLEEKINKNNQKTEGLIFYAIDVNRVSTIHVLLCIVEAVRLHGISVTYKKIFDRAAGSPLLRNLLSGTITKNEFDHEVNKQLNEFYEKARPFFLYEPFPRIFSIKI